MVAPGSWDCGPDSVSGQQLRPTLGELVLADDSVAAKIGESGDLVGRTRGRTGDTAGSTAEGFALQVVVLGLVDGTGVEERLGLGDLVGR